MYTARPPGQGMNTGIADAYDLATRLGAVLTGQADLPVLDDYQRYRRAAALEILQFTDRMTHISMLSNPLARTLRTRRRPNRRPDTVDPAPTHHLDHRSETQPASA
jgi:2-polyprenyl-6-methoxyphenol hydroxylase-like FAD-dependent oxidoreductase